ncbi:hypothetical protein [Pseudoruegeria sp. HB172150]|nr:hypothetical protein [Pseudoruegeria sp. HB172150]
MPRDVSSAFVLLLIDGLQALWASGPAFETFLHGPELLQQLLRSGPSV